MSSAGLPSCLRLLGIGGRDPGRFDTTYGLAVADVILGVLCAGTHQSGCQESFKIRRAAYLHKAGFSKPLEGADSKFLQDFKQAECQTMYVSTYIVVSSWLIR